MRLEGSDDHGAHDWPRVTVGHRNPTGSGWAGRTTIRSRHRPPTSRATTVDEFSEPEPEPDDSDTAPTPIASEADPNSGRHASIALDEQSRTIFDEPVVAPADGPSTSRRRTDAPERQTAIPCRSTIPTWPPPGTRSRRTPSPAATGRRRAISTTTCPPRSTSSTRNSPAPTGSSRATSCMSGVRSSGSR